MDRQSFGVAICIFALFSGCGSSGIGATSESVGQSVGTVANNGSVAGQGHHALGPCTPANTMAAPADGLVADFSDVNFQVPGRIITYALPKLADPGSLTHTTSGGHLTIKVNATAIPYPQFLGTEIQFNKCVDASAFTGVQYTISGSFSGCLLTYSTGDDQHQDATKSSGFASGPAGSYPAHDKIAPGDVTSAPRIVKQPFSGGDTKGNPPTPVDPTKLIFTLWQFIVPIAADDGSATPACTGSVTIDDIKFYR